MALQKTQLRITTLLLMSEIASVFGGRPLTESKPSDLVSYYCGERFIQVHEMICKIDAGVWKRRRKRSLAGDSLKGLGILYTVLLLI